MPVTHEPWLVAPSLFLAIQGSYVGLSLAVQVGDAIGLRRRLLIAAAAVSLAFAVWTMHFIGMLAARMPSSVDYLVFPTLLSFLICVIVVGAAVFAAYAGPLTPARLAAAAVFMGLGIVSMHHTGMTALHASAHMTHASLFVAGSIVIAIAASGLALWLANGRGGRPPLLLSATALGIAIAGMHYTAMKGVTIFPHPMPGSGAPAISSDLLAIVVAIVAFLVSGIFLLALVPDRAQQATARGASGFDGAAVCGDHAAGRRTRAAAPSRPQTR
jgi:NO-binding membrane sensor protein with MHYT domain